MVLFPEAGFVRSSMASVVMLFEFVVVEYPERPSEASLWSAGVFPPHTLRPSVSKVYLLRVVGVLRDVTVVISSMV